MIDLQITRIQNAQISIRWLTVLVRTGQMPLTIPGVGTQGIGCSPPPPPQYGKCPTFGKYEGGGPAANTAMEELGFFPFLMEYALTNFLKKRWIFVGKNVFAKGIDNSSCFGPELTGKVELWFFFDFNT